jgi:hypothetical protein
MLLWFTLSLIVVAGVLFAVREFRIRRSSGQEPVFMPGQYALNKSLFTEFEASFYQTLVRLDLPDVVILAKVRLADIFKVRWLRRAQLQQDIFRAIAQQYVDFLVVRVDDCRPVLAIELYDGSERDPDQGKHDLFVHDVFADCGLPLLNLPTDGIYTAAVVRRLIYDAAPLNFPLSGIAERLERALQPSDRRLKVG